MILMQLRSGAFLAVMLSHLRGRTAGNHVFTLHILLTESDLINIALFPGQANSEELDTTIQEGERLSTIGLCWL